MFFFSDHVFQKLQYLEFRGSCLEIAEIPSFSSCFDDDIGLHAILMTSFKF
jgi:hypothetical protein